MNNWCRCLETLSHVASHQLNWRGAPFVLSRSFHSGYLVEPIRLIHLFFSAHRTHCIQLAGLIVPGRRFHPIRRMNSIQFNSRHSSNQPNSLNWLAPTGLIYSIAPRLNWFDRLRRPSPTALARPLTSNSNSGSFNSNTDQVRDAMQIGAASSSPSFRSIIDYDWLVLAITESLRVRKTERKRQSKTQFIKPTIINNNNNNNKTLPKESLRSYQSSTARNTHKTIRMVHIVKDPWRSWGSVRKHSEG